MKLTKIEEAILKLAYHVERCPYCDARVEDDIADILGLERETPPEMNI